MPQTSSAQKALRVSARRRAINDRWRRKVHAAVLHVRNAIRAGQKDAAVQAYHKAVSTLDRAARRNIIHPNRASRKKSRLAKAIQKVGT